MKRCLFVLVPFCAVLAAGWLLPGVLRAGNVAYQIPFGTGGNQAFDGALGMDFDVNTAISISKLGVFDSFSDGMATTITAELWSRSGNTGTLISSLAFDTGSPGDLLNGSRFKSLAIPQVLGPGSYTISARGYNGAELNGNGGGFSFGTTDSSSNAIAFVGGGRYNFPVVPGAFPENPDGGPANRYGAGTFEYDALPFSAGPFTAYINHVGGVGTQDYDGELGMDFVVTRPISVDSLGVFDSNADGIFANAITADLWSRDDGGTPNDPADDVGIAILATDTFTPNDPGVLVDSNRFKRLSSPLVLQPGAYTIVAGGYGLSEPNGNTGTGGPNDPFKTVDSGLGALTFVGGSRYNFPPAPGTFPAFFDGGPSNRYSAGTFQFSEVPEPSTFVLAALGLLAFGVRGRCRG